MSDFREFQQQYNDYLMHSGRKGMKWGKSIFQDDYDPIGEVAGSLSNAYNYVRQLGGRAKDAAENAYNYLGQTARNGREYINDHVTGSSYRDAADRNRADMDMYRARAKRDLDSYRTARAAERDRELGISTRNYRAMQALGLNSDDFRRQHYDSVNRYKSAGTGYVSNMANYNNSAAGRLRQGAQNAVNSAKQGVRNLTDGVRNITTSHDVYKPGSRTNGTQQVNSHTTAEHEVTVGGSPTTKGRNGNNGDSNSVIDDIREGARNAYNSAKEGVQNLSEGARKQAFMARGNASVAADKARNAINNIPNEARQAFHRVGIEADRLTSRGLRRAADILEKYGVREFRDYIPSGVAYDTPKPLSELHAPSYRSNGVDRYSYGPRDEDYNPDAVRLRNQAANRDLRRIADTLNPFSGNKQQNTSSRQNGSMNGIDLDKLRLDATNTIDRGKEELGAGVLRGLGRALNVDSKEEEERYRRIHANNRRRNTANYARNH